MTVGRKEGIGEHGARQLLNVYGLCQIGVFDHCKWRRGYNLLTHGREKGM